MRRPRSLHGCQVAVLVVWSCTGVPLLAQTPSTPDVTIRVYDTFGFQSSEMRAAESVAGTILKTAGVHDWWRECWKDGGVARGDIRVCGEVLNPTEIIVRLIIDRSGRHERSMSLGYSLVVGEGRPATFATVLGNRVTELAERARFNRATLLGRAIAHEAGHLLLGTRDHSSVGLMRAHWSDASLRESEKSWGFSLQEGHIIRGRLGFCGQNSRRQQTSNEDAASITQGFRSKSRADSWNAAC